MADKMERERMITARTLVLVAVLAGCGDVEGSESTEEFVWRAYVDHVDVPEDEIDWVTPAEMLKTAEDTCATVGVPGGTVSYDKDTVQLARALVETLCPSKLALLG